MIIISYLETSYILHKPMLIFYQSIRCVLSNGVLVEFLPDSFYIKELGTKNVIFHGKCDHGLYKLHQVPCMHQVSSTLFDKVLSRPLFSSALFTSTFDKRCNWNTRLGHPYEIIMNKLAKLVDLNYKIDSVFSKCLMCPFAKVEKVTFCSNYFKISKTFCSSVGWSLDFYSFNHIC